MRVSDRTMIVLSLAMTVAGLLGLYGLVLFSELPLSDLDAVDHADPETSLRVQATVVAARQAKNVTIVTLRQEVTRTAIIFEAVNLSPGDRVDAVGEAQEYEGESELVIRSLKIIS